MPADYRWNYLLHPDYSRRYAEIVKFLRSGDYVFDVGTVSQDLRRSLENLPGIRVTTCDVADAQSPCLNPADAFIKGRLSEVVDHVIDDDQPTVVVGLGLDLLDDLPLQGYRDFLAFFQVARSARLVAVEYPTNWWRSRLQAEALVSLLEGRILRDQEFDFSRVSGTPRHAGLRRLIIFEPSDAVDESEVERLFRAMFGRFSLPGPMDGKRGELVPFTPTVALHNRTLAKGRDSSFVIEAHGPPWSYLATFRPQSQAVGDNYYSIEVHGSLELVNICSVLNGELTFESSLHDVRFNRFDFFLKSGEEILFRIGATGGSVRLHLKFRGVRLT